MFLIKRNQIQCFIASILLCLGILLMPFLVSAQTIPNDTQNQVVLFGLIEKLQAQIALLQKQLAAQEKTESQTTLVTAARPSTVFDGVPVLKRYNIAKESDAKNITNLEHRQFLKRVYEVFPDEYDEKLKEFVVFKDKGGDFGAFVETIPPDHTGWSFAINTDVLGKENTQSSTELIVHELAHIVSYESIAGIPLSDSAACHEYFRKRGCPKENAYISVFADAFWSSADLHRALALREGPDAIDLAYGYYKTTEDEYVSDYAALSPEEDFAESFAQYVVNLGPQTNTLSSEKVWWFDQFTELQDIRLSGQ